MVKTIFNQLWNQRKMNFWIFLELLAVSFFLWLVLDPVYVLNVNKQTPRGMKVKGGMYSTWVVISQGMVIMIPQKHWHYARKPLCGLPVSYVIYQKWNISAFLEVMRSRMQEDFMATLSLLTPRRPPKKKGCMSNGLKTVAMKVANFS